MWYAVISEDVEGSIEKRAPVRDRHLERLKTLRDEGRLLVAGPHPAIDAEDPGAAGFTGSLVIAEFPSLTDAEQWAESDPYVEAGVYRSTVVKPFKRVLP